MKMNGDLTTKHNHESPQDTSPSAAPQRRESQWSPWGWEADHHDEFQSPSSATAEHAQPVKGKRTQKHSRVTMEHKTYFEKCGIALYNGSQWGPNVSSLFAIFCCSCKLMRKSWDLQKQIKNKPCWRMAHPLVKETFIRSRSCNHSSSKR